MVARGRLSLNTLRVLLDGSLSQVLFPGCEPCLFGRSGRCQIRIGRLSETREDSDMSRIAGSIRWDGAWTVHNESTSRPFDVLVNGLVIPLAHRTADTPSIWAVSPPGLDLRISTRYSVHLIGLRLVDAATGDPKFGETEPDGIHTDPLEEPNPYERLVLTAKFLSRTRPGDAIGNEETADRVNRTRPGTGRPTTGKAVEDVVRRWRDRLEARGVTGIRGRENIHALGRQLLAHGFIRQEDRDSRRPG